jgi:Predicted transcriptional regulators
VVMESHPVVRYNAHCGTHDMARTSGTLRARFSGEFMENLHQHLSQALKQLRQANGWSLTLAAARTGVSKAMLGQIERGESSPTIATLWKIATGFNVPFSFFVQSGAQPSGDVATFSQPNAQMQVKPLLPYDARLRFDLLEVTLARARKAIRQRTKAG